MKGINEFMNTHRAEIPTRFDESSTCSDLHDDFMLGYKFLLVKQGDETHKARFQPCENKDDVNYFLNSWVRDEHFTGEYAVYEMKAFGKI